MRVVIARVVASSDMAEANGACSSSEGLASFS